MSIVAAAGAPNELLPEAAVGAACLALSLPVTYRLVRRGSFKGDDRLPPGGSAWALVVALGCGLFVWTMVQAAYLTWRGPALNTAATQPTQPSTAPDVPPPLPPDNRTIDLANLPPGDVAFLSTVPHASAFVALLMADLLIYAGALKHLGFSLRQAAGGIWAGLALSAAFVPLVFGGAALVEWIYRGFGYVHPPEHPLLRVLASSPMSIRITLVLGATLIVPLAEELLFRGHIQTVLRRVLVRLSGVQAGMVAPAWAVWGAIGLTSAAFASVHPIWTAPPIFLLSLCLGWAYERWGNLWTPVAIHAIFNAVSTAVFLKWGGGH